MRERLQGLLAILLSLSTVFGGWWWSSGFIPWEKAWWHHLFNYLKANMVLPLGFTESLVAGFVMLLLSFIVIVWVNSRAHTKSRHQAFDQTNLHGSASYATVEDVKRSGLIKTEGVALGVLPETGQQLCHNGPAHVLGIGATRTGKGITWVMRTMDNWTASTVSLDIKGEIFAKTSGFKAALGHKAFKFQPTDVNGGTRFNPLTEIRADTDYFISDAQNIASILLDTDGRGLKDFWAKTGWEWMTVGILHTITKIQDTEGRRANLRDVSLVMSGGNVDTVPKDEEELEELTNQIFDDMASYNHGNHDVDREVKRVARLLRYTAHQQRSGTVATAQTELAIYADPIVAKNTAVSDFKIDDLMNSDVPCHLYLVMDTDNLLRLRPIIRLMFNILLRGLTKNLSDPSSQTPSKHRLLLLLDELTSIGKVEIFEDSLAFLAGYGIKAFPIVQDKEQLEKTYGRDNSIQANCDATAVFTPNKDETAQWVSRMLGNTTVVLDRESVSRKAGDFSGSNSVSLTEIKRPLMTPEEVRTKLRKFNEETKEPGEVLIFVGGQKPIRAVQNPYFLDKDLLKRTQLPPHFDRSTETTISTETGNTGNARYTQHINALMPTNATTTGA